MAKISFIVLISGIERASTPSSGSCLFQDLNQEDYEE